MLVRDLGLIDYREAWALQEQAHLRVLDGGQETLFVLEHPPVVTLGRRAGVSRHLVASEQQLAQLGVQLVQTDRGGDITFHGPGQLVGYPIVRLIDHGLSVGGYVHTLERVVIECLKTWGIDAQTDPSAVGVWVGHGGQQKKICALGVRIRRGISLHGIALNVTTDLRYFNLMVPCGLQGKGVTSLQELLGERCPAMAEVKQVFARHMERTFPEQA